jgi:hypothetical protein
MEKIKALYMFLDETADSTKHQATVDTPSVTLTVVGVSSPEIAIQTAKQFIREGKAELVELCGACGYKVAKAVSEAVGDQAPVGMIVHQFDNAPKICELIKKWG